MSETKQTKLQRLVEFEGYDDEQKFLEAIMMDSVCPGICCNPGCDYTTEVEPDQDAGWCELCGTGSVKSALILAGLI
jgi:hypothetical protein